jgi:type I restriction enzyme M protein
LRGEKPLEFSDKILLYMDTLLTPVDLHDDRNDPLGDLYEVFMGSLARGQQGQFFTPPNAVDLLVDLVEPQPGQVILDPACGAGGFLASTVRHMMRKGELTTSVVSNLWGIDKDDYLTHLAALRIALLTGNEASIWCADSLTWRPANGSVSAPKEFDRADVILTNPPFGSKIVAVAPEAQRTFALGHRWTLDKATGRYAKTSDVLLRSLSPQVAFVERCIELLAPGGRIGMVVPESLLSSNGYGYVVQFIRDHMDIQAVLGMPETLFKTSGSGGTHTKTCLLVAQKRTSQGKDRKLIFMAEAKWCGNDSRGRRIGPDELPKISERYHMESKARPIDHLSYEISQDAIKGSILVPRYYDPEVSQLLRSLQETHELVNVGSLVESGVLELRSGDEIGSENYGTGDIPFVRTSDISNWEIKLDPKHGDPTMYTRSSP